MSPGTTLSFNSTGAAGTSSHQAEYRGFTEAEHTASVPICSRACESASNPPRPTQTAAYAACPRVHLAAGCFHVPVTLVNDTGALDDGGTESSVGSVLSGAETAYPAQLVLTAGSEVALDATPV